MDEYPAPTSARPIGACARLVFSDRWFSCCNFRGGLAQIGLHPHERFLPMSSDAIETPTGEAELNRQTLDHPRTGQAVTVFASWIRACEHLRDHLLSRPECRVWTLLSPHIRDLLDCEDRKAVYQLCRQWQADRGVSAQPLYDLYCQAICQALVDALRPDLEWVSTRQVGGRTITAFLGINGILGLIGDTTLVTAYVPGQRDREAYHKACQEFERAAEEAKDPENWFDPRPLRDRESVREYTQRPSDGRRLRRGMPTLGEERRDGRHCGEHTENWSEDERLFYRVFRPAVRTIRAAVNRQPDPASGVEYSDQELTGPEYSVLNDRLPRCIERNFEQWQRWREHARQ